MNMNLFLSAILLNLLFIVSAIGKIKNFTGTVKSLKNVFWIKNLPNWFFNLSIIGVIILLLAAPSIIMYSLFNPKYNIYLFSIKSRFRKRRTRRATNKSIY